MDWQRAEILEAYGTAVPTPANMLLQWLASGGCDCGVQRYRCSKMCSRGALLTKSIKTKATATPCHECSVYEL